MNLKHELKENTWLRGCEVGWGNGYVSLPPDHPYHGADYDEIPVDVHGGITYGDADGEDWKVGFDTAHSGDTSVNWPRERVEEETLRLKEQLERLAEGRTQP